MGNSKTIHPSLKSGLTGGAATGLGVDYQTLYAVYLALRLIVRLLRDSPLLRPILSIEPRILGTGSVTRWDLSVYPDDLLIEAKGNPTKQDLVELLRRARKSTESSQEQQFELVYDDCKVGFLDSLKKLTRLATESHQDKNLFTKLCELESDDNLAEVLQILDDSALNIGSLLTLRHFPTLALNDAINLHLQFLVSPAQTKHLKNGLYASFTAAMSKRQPFFIPELMRNLAADGIEFVNAQAVLPMEIDPLLHKVVFLLQKCRRGLPLSILAATCQESEASLEELLAKSSAVAADGEWLWHVNPLPAPVDHKNGFFG